MLLAQPPAILIVIFITKRGRCRFFEFFRAKSGAINKLQMMSSGITMKSLFSCDSSILNKKFFSLF